MLINGVQCENVQALDRGFQYGDGLFETIALRKGKICLWKNHIDRLNDGCSRLNITQQDTSLLAQEAQILTTGVDNGIIKIIITRGVGGRGYRSLPGDCLATRVLGLFEPVKYPKRYWQEGVVTRICNTKLSENRALAGIKHLNRLEQVLARNEWQDSSIAEGIMLDTQGHIVEGTFTNIFMVKKGDIVTPHVDRSGIAGIMRNKIVKLAESLHIRNKTRRFNLRELLAADEVFLCNSIIGIWPVKQVGTTEFSVGPVTRQLWLKLQPIIGI